MAETYKTSPSEKDAHLDKLWEKYKSSGDPELKNELLLNYIDLVKNTVRRMMPKYNRYNEFDDLVNCGVIGLIDAVDKFSLEHGVKFEVYAVSRIRGEILDYMRSQDWAPPSMRKKLNQIAKAYEQAESDPAITDADAYAADELDMTTEQIHKILNQSYMFNLMNFEDSISAVNSTPVRQETLPENRVLDKELKKELVELIDRLPEKERLVITLYYYEGLLLKEIADILNVTESRVSQIHSKVLLKLKTKLNSAI